MADEPSQQGNDGRAGAGKPGGNAATAAPRMVGLTTYFTLLPMVLLYFLVIILSAAKLDPTSEASALAVQLLIWPVPISLNVQLLVTAILAGALGSYMHAVTSFTSYVGNRTLRRSWHLWYYLRPFMGGVLALSGCSTEPGEKNFLFKGTV